MTSPQLWPITTTTVVTVEGTPAELLDFMHRAQQALGKRVDLGDGGRLAGP
ncbi:hypothetical protein [Amycolatopsis sp. cg9]|uniref:hypothetical protein n=1 Tax=Amycolatopsis sp. cg9 TaxID=3238801 RepID=UPI003525014E